MKRQDISGLQKNRSIFLKIGFIGSLSLMVMAFNYTVEQPKVDLNEEAHQPTIEKDIEIIRTQHPKQLPPPIFTPKENLEMVEEVTIEEQPVEPKKVSLIIDEEVEPNFTDDGFEGDDIEIEPEVDEAPLDILIEEPVRDFAEYMPSFGKCDVSLGKAAYKACSDQALLQYFAKNIRYPSVARENGIEGRVILRFVIDEKGAIESAKVMRGVSGGCSEEALRVLQNMPTWKPGRHGGRNVKVNFTLPVTFKLNN